MRFTGVTGTDSCTFAASEGYYFYGQVALTNIKAMEAIFDHTDFHGD